MLLRVTVHSADGGRKVLRERWGGHRGFGVTVSEAIENCMKSAETDALKRALVTFGNVFGLALYDRTGKNIGKTRRRRTRRMYLLRRRVPQSPPSQQTQKAATKSSPPRRHSPIWRSVRALSPAWRRRPGCSCKPS